MDDYGDDCRGKVAELEAQRDRNYNGWCEAAKEVARRAAEVEALRAQLAEAHALLEQDVESRPHNWSAVIVKRAKESRDEARELAEQADKRAQEVEALRAERDRWRESAVVKMGETGDTLRRLAAQIDDSIITLSADTAYYPLLQKALKRERAAERNLEKANAQLKQWESGEKERVGAHALKADLQKRLAAAEARAEKAEAALPPAGILSDIRTITATYAFIGTSGVSFATAVRCGERVQAWLATLPTPEAQP